MSLLPLLRLTKRVMQVWTNWNSSSESIYSEQQLWTLVMWSNYLGDFTHIEWCLGISAGDY